MTHPNCRKKRTPRFLSGKAVVVVASRAASVGRAVLNEQELVDYIAATYDVHLEVVTEDSNSTWQMVDLMRVGAILSCSTLYSLTSPNEHLRCGDAGLSAARSLLLPMQTPCSPPAAAPPTTSCGA